MAGDTGSEGPHPGALLQPAGPPPTQAVRHAADDIDIRQWHSGFGKKTPDAPDIDFVVGGDFNLPNGGLFARFPGLYIPIVDMSFNGPAPTDTQFHTDVIIRQYDGVEDFPLYPLNLVADLNALLGAVYVGLYGADVSLAPDASKSPAIQSRDGDSTYYFFETQDLPLFGPLRTLGVPESLIDVVEPFFRVIVELGYDRSIPPWGTHPGTADPDARPSEGGYRSDQRGRRGYQQRRGPPRSARIAAHSRDAGYCRSGRCRGAGRLGRNHPQEDHRRRE